MWLNTTFTRRPLRAALCAASIYAVASLSPAHAGPWVDPSNERTRHHLQVLSDAGNVKVLTTSWPVMWSDIKQALDRVDPTRLAPQALWSYKYLKHELRKADNYSKNTLSLHASSAPPAMASFSTDNREQYEASAGLELTGDSYAVRIRGTYAPNAPDEREARADGSFGAMLFGNWAVGFGAIDRWWGPGWESSLILSDRARPTPGLFLQRRNAVPFETPLLSWLGPWQLTTFMSELEEYRYVPDTLLWGMRVNFMPLESLEIGLSRTAMWGGEGRPTGIDTFFDMLIGNDNRGDGGVDEDMSNEPGNQLAGVDFRWGFGLGQTSNALYAQLIGEDEAGGLPSRHIGLAGLEVSTLIWDTQVRFSLEGQNTTVYFYESDKIMPNTAYEHVIYQSGYRYRGLPIGAGSDNDSETYTARAQLYLSNGQRLQIALGKARINYDNGTSSYPDGGSVWGPSEVNDSSLTIEYNVPVSKNFELQIGLFEHSETLRLQGEEIETGGYIGVSGSL